MCCIFFIHSFNGYLGCIHILTIVNGAAKNKECIKVKVLVTQSMSDSATLKIVARQAPLSIGFLIQEYWSGLPFPSPGDLPKPGIKPRSPTLQVHSLLFEPPGKPKNTGVGSLSLLQGNFPTQESNPGLLHCRLILYQLSYPGSLYLTSLPCLTT